MAESTIGSLKILIGGDTTGLEQAEARTKTSLGNIESMAKKVIATLGILATIKMGVDFIRSSNELIDTQSKLARQLGGTVAGVQTLARVADLANLSQEDMQKSMSRLNKTLGEAERNSLSPAADALKRLGLNARDLSKMDVDTRMAAIGDALKSTGMSAQRTAATLGDLGLRQGRMIALFENGGQAIRDARAELEKWGVLVSDVDAEGIENANDAMKVFNVAATAVANNLVKEMAPILFIVAQRFKEMGDSGEGFGTVVVTAIQTVVKGFLPLLQVIYQTKREWNAFIDGIGTGLKGFATAWNATIGRFVMPFTPKDFEDIDSSIANLKLEVGEAPTQENWDAWFAAMKKKLKDAAEASIAARKALSGAGGDGGDDISSQERKALEEKLNQLKQSVAAEDQVLVMHRDKQLKDLAEFQAKGIASTQQANALKLQIEGKYQEDLANLMQSRILQGVMTEQELRSAAYDKQLEDFDKFNDSMIKAGYNVDALRLRAAEKFEQDMNLIRAQSWTRAANVIDSAMSDITAIMGNQSGKQFAIVKAISMATALMKGYEAVVSAYAAGNALGGPILGQVFAGIAAAATAAQIARIAGVGQNSTGVPTAGGGGGGHHGGGGHGGGGGGGGGQNVPTPMAHSLTIKGLNRNDLFTGDAVREIARQMIEYQRNGGKVFIR